MLAKIRELIKSYHSELVLAVAVIAITIISFNLGRMSVGNSVAKLPLTIFTPNASSFSAPTGATQDSAPRDERVVASKASSSKLYHFTWCSGAKRITDKNKITFPNESAAIAAGYSLAGNCQK